MGGVLAKHLQNRVVIPLCSSIFIHFLIIVVALLMPLQALEAIVLFSNLLISGFPRIYFFQMTLAHNLSFFNTILYSNFAIRVVFIACIFLILRPPYFLSLCDCIPIDGRTLRLSFEPLHRKLLMSLSIFPHTPIRREIVCMI